MNLDLVQATFENDHMDRLQSEWAAQLRDYDDDPEDVDNPWLEHAVGIANENPTDSRYGIFMLVDGDADTENRYVGIVHVNHAFPKTTYATVRITWMILAPKYDYIDVDDGFLIDVFTAVVMGGVNLSRDKMSSRELKICLTGSADRRFGKLFAWALGQKEPAWKVDVKGNWIHIVL